MKQGAGEQEEKRQKKSIYKDLCQERGKEFISIDVFSELSANLLL